jgi:HlyD family secretion protein
MWQKKAVAGTTEAQAPPALALRPETEHAEEPAYAPFPDNGGKDVAMADRPRSGRWLWIVGVLLLIATAIGAAWAINSGNGSDAGLGQTAATPPGIVSLGQVDVEPGIAKLYPLQPGRVLFVAPEGKFVKKGDVILSVDKKLANFNLQQATAALEDARLLLKEAEKKPKKHEIDQQTQKKVIAIATSKMKVAEYELEKTKKLLGEKVVSKEDLGIVQETYNGLADLVEIEKNKLKQLELVDPKVDVNRIQRDVDAKEAQKGKAELALEECDIRAPSDGTVLRVFVQEGEILGPDPKFPAIQFCPNSKRIVRAEVLQEWAGHVAEGQKAIIEDDTHSGVQWTGKVKYVSDWITQKRGMILEPFMVNDVRTLECVIDVNPGGPPMRIGQRVRVTIQQGNP